MNNKLFIIGNGFDLAHGLETSYNQFILWYFNQAIQHFNNGVSYNDGFILGVVSSKIPLPKIENIPQLYKILDNGKSKTFILMHPWAASIKNSLQKNNWVDFESIYFEIIKDILNENTYSLSDKISSIEGVNSNFELFRRKFIEYLNQINLGLNARVGSNTFYEINKYSKEYKKLSALFLNFNYTNLLHEYLSNNIKNRYGNWDIKKPTNYLDIEGIINIHGSLTDFKNPIIFGYGGLKNNEYTTLKNLNSKEVLKYIKSFDYFQTNNFINLHNFLLNDYDVHIIGHSCGISDSFILNNIFERQECKNIFFHYWKQSESRNNYKDIILNISRCFFNDDLMHSKVRSFQECVPFIIE
jgi:hypothetical protein